MLVFDIMYGVHSNLLIYSSRQLSFVNGLEELSPHLLWALLLVLVVDFDQETTTIAKPFVKVVTS